VLPAVAVADIVPRATRPGQDDEPAQDQEKTQEEINTVGLADGYRSTPPEGHKAPNDSTCGITAGRGWCTGRVTARTVDRGGR
jgi:hypothetical protein